MEKFKVGDRAKHELYGIGIINRIDPITTTFNLCVSFDDGINIFCDVFREEWLQGGRMIKELANICLIIILLLLSISLILLGIMAIIYLIGLIKETLYEIQVDDKERNSHGKR